MKKPENMDFVVAITLGIALTGAILGIINTVRTFSRDRIKLKVIPKHAFGVGGAQFMYPNIEFCIEVINLGAFPIVISEVGFLHRGTKQRSVVIKPITTDNNTIPRKFDTRDAVSFYMAKPSPHLKHDLSCAYARTSCGRTFKGVSPSLKQMNQK